MNKKIYEVIVPRGKQALFYIRNGYLTLVEDNKYPLVFGSSHEWSPENGYAKISNQYTETTRIIFPTAKIAKKDFKKYIQQCLADFDQAGYSEIDGNIIVAKRELDNDYIDVGVTIYDAITEREIG